MHVCVALVVLGSILCKTGDFNNSVLLIEEGLQLLRETIPKSPLTAEGTMFIESLFLILVLCLLVRQLNLVHCRFVLSCIHCNETKPIGRSI